MNETTVYCTKWKFTVFYENKICEKKCRNWKSGYVDDLTRDGKERVVAVQLKKRMSALTKEQMLLGMAEPCF